MILQNRGYSRWIVLSLAGLLAPALLPAQQDPSDGRPGATGSGSTDVTPKRIFGIVPNYRTSPTLDPYTPLTISEKFKLALTDSLDRGTFILAGAFAGQAQMSKSSPSFGQGVAGYARYFGTAYGDYAIGDFMTEGIYPGILHQDPRYFRRGTGTTGSRLLYAMGQIFWTHTDSGRMQFNYSEVAGNATAAAISNLYYPDNRNVSSTVSKLAIQLGVDMAGNILKEFSTDLSRKLSHHHSGKP